MEVEDSWGGGLIHDLSSYPIQVRPVVTAKRPDKGQLRYQCLVCGRYRTVSMKDHVTGGARPMPYAAWANRWLRGHRHGGTQLRLPWG